MSRARTDSRLFRSGASAGKPGRKPGAAAASIAPLAPLPVKDSGESGQQVDPDLTRALKQIFESRNCVLKDHGSSPASRGSPNSSSKNSGSEESGLTLFGKKLVSPSSSVDGSDSSPKNMTQYSRQGTDKLPPAATAHLLKELHKQRLKQRGITATASDFPDMGEIEFVHTEKRPEVSTLPLLVNLQEKRPVEKENVSDCGPEAKRQRIDRDKSLDLSLSVEFGSPNEAEVSRDASSMAIDGEERSAAAVKNPEQLTLFYNGQVLVYDDVPSDKAKAIMVLASSISSKTSCYSPALAAVAAVAPTATPAAAPAKVYSAPKGTVPAPEKRTSNDVQARKASISRFLEKRKDRLNPNPNPKAVAASEKAEASSKSFPKDNSRSRSPSPATCNTPVTPPRSSSRCGLVDELKQQLEKGELLKRSASSGAGANSSLGGAGAKPTGSNRAWIGV